MSQVRISARANRATAGRDGSLGLGVALAAALFGAGAGEARAAADLVIVERDSIIRFESCEDNEPLATGIIAIKNIGDSRTTTRLGVLTRLSRSMLAVYVPEHLDLIDNAFERSVMNARDQESIRIAVGRGAVKRGRFTAQPGGGVGSAGAGSYAGAFGTANDPLDPDFRSAGGRADDGGYRGGASGGYAGAATTVELAPTAVVLIDDLTGTERQEMQRALRDLGYYSGQVDGVFGSAVEQAIRSFQRSQRADANGRLTVAQVEELSRQSGRALAIGAVEPVGGYASAPTYPSYSGTVAGSGSSTRGGALPRAALNRSGPGFGRVEVTLYAVVDPYNLVEESDETNNLVRFTGVIDCN